MSRSKITIFQVNYENRTHRGWEEWHSIPEAEEEFGFTGKPALNAAHSLGEVTRLGRYSYFYSMNTF